VSVKVSEETEVNFMDYFLSTTAIQALEPGQHDVFRFTCRPQFVFTA
jgi:hypothetical protein